jgi:hypothetical protein
MHAKSLGIFPLFIITADLFSHTNHFYLTRCRSLLPSYRNLQSNGYHSCFLSRKSITETSILRVVVPIEIFSGFPQSSQENTGTESKFVTTTFIHIPSNHLFTFYLWTL